MVGYRVMDVGCGGVTIMLDGFWVGYQADQGRDE